MNIGVNSTINKAIGIRIRNLRKDNDMTQEEVVRLLSNMFGKSSRMPCSTLSSWELGIKTPSIPYLVGIADIFNVSVDYLLGRVSLEQEDGYTIPASCNIESYIVPIGPKELGKYDGKPVLISYENSGLSQEWGIYDAKGKRFYCKGKIIKRSAVDKYFATAVGSCPEIDDDKKALSATACAGCDQVWIEYSGIDLDMTIRISGWYKVDKEKKIFENLEGMILPFNGLGIHYKAYKEKPDYLQYVPKKQGKR